MFISPTFKMAIKCSKCGEYVPFNIDLFKAKSSSSLKCSCGHDVLSYELKNGELHFEIDCVVCDKKHKYRYKVKELIERPLKVVNCPFSGIEIAFAGKHSSVDGIIIRYESDFEEFLMSLGFMYKSRLGRV